jgi:hypothetical protein
MPVTYPHYDDDAGRLVEHTYYDAAEVADMLHMHPNTVRQRIRDGAWDALRVGRNVYMDGQQIGDAVASMRTNGAGLVEDTPPPRLGTPLDPTDGESLQ